MRYTARMKNKLIVFDFDGVLFDSIELILTFNAKRFIDIPRAELIELFTGNIYETMRDCPWPKQISPEEEVNKRIEEYVALKLQAPMYAGMKELLRDIHVSHTLAINTYSRPDRSIPLLEREGIAALFDLIATYDPNNPELQTKIDKFKTIAEHYGIGMEDMLFVTDSLGDVREAAKLGIPTVAVTWGMHGRHFFEREPHPHLVAIVDTPEALKQAIDSQA